MASMILLPSGLQIESEPECLRDSARSSQGKLIRMAGRQTQEPALPRFSRPHDRIDSYPAMILAGRYGSGHRRWEWNRVEGGDDAGSLSFLRVERGGAP